jgi:ketosteroid isomerase-like protein
MSQENVETLRRANEAFRRGDQDLALASYHADVQWRDLQHAPDTPERVLGLAALRAVWKQWDQAFDELTADISEYIDAGDFVVAATRWVAKGRESGVALDLHTVDVYEFVDGKIVGVTVGYEDKRAALAAVGLDDQ